MCKEKVKKPFNQSEYDSRYRASCTADVDCADNCDMECRYKKEDAKSN